MTPQAITIGLDDGAAVSGLWLGPPAAQAGLVLAHGARAGMAPRSMADLTEGLAARGLATLRFQFPSMERGSKRPDPPAVAYRAVRAAVDQARRRAGDLPLLAGGRSFGGRMASQAQAEAPLPRVRRLVFFAFPLHPAGKPSDDRAAHLAEVKIPMLFVQGTRDKLADLRLLRPVLVSLRSRATPLLLKEADHGFHVPAATGGVIPRSWPTCSMEPQPGWSGPPTRMAKPDDLIASPLSKHAPCAIEKSFAVPLRVCRRQPLTIHMDGK